MKQPQHLAGIFEENNLFPPIPFPEIDEFLQGIKANIENDHVGLLVGLKFIDTILGGLLPARYILLGAHPNVGKTKTVDFCVISACLYAIKYNVNVTFFYASLELSETKKKADWVCLYINLKYGLIFDSDFVLGYKKDSKPNEQDMELITEGYAFVKFILSKYIRLSAQAVTGRDLIEGILPFYAPYGTVVREPAKKGLGKFKSFTPNGKPLPLAFLVVDHLALLSGPNSKTAMDDMSLLAVQCRNHLHMSFIFVQQLNQQLIQTRRESLSRHGKGKAHDHIFPKQLDFGDSTYTYRDADAVFGFVRPLDFELDEFDTIPCVHPGMGGLGNCLLIAVNMKNRNGGVGAYYPLFLNGASGVLYDLPNQFDADYTSFINLAKKLYG
jgi:hypothetical protein